jgi:hypothetical protein
MGENGLKMLHALHAKGASKHARAHDLTSNFSKFSGGDPPYPYQREGVFSKYNFSCSCAFGNNTYTVTQVS